MRKPRGLAQGSSSFLYQSKSHCLDLVAPNSDSEKRIKAQIQIMKLERKKEPQSVY